MKARVLEVSLVHLHVSKTGRLTIATSGVVTTSGWCCGELQPRIYLKPPGDGIWDWDFVAQPPSGIALQVINAITAQTEEFVAPDWMRGVRVHASANSVEQLLPQHNFSSTAAAPTRDPGDFFPWAVAGIGTEVRTTSAAGPDNEVFVVLRGKSLRKCKSGDPNTDDFRDDRFNCELDSKTDRIVSAWIG